MEYKKYQEESCQIKKKIKGTGKKKQGASLPKIVTGYKLSTGIANNY